ncbi:hypothetical protein [Kaarinaea lacus]
MNLQIRYPMPGQLFYIDELGCMPALRCEASLRDSHNQILKAPMQWILQISENIWPGACPSAKMGKQVLNLQSTSVGMGIWIPSFNNVCGGDATLIVGAEYQGEVYQASVNFRIRGKNPSPDAVEERLGGIHAPSTQLARFLSALQQFDVQGMPYVGAHGEVGIMQLCDPAAQWTQRWNWMHNVEAGKARLQSLQGIAKSYLDQHRIEGHYPNNRLLTDGDVLLRETIQRFLGGTYWQWDKRQLQWCANPPDDTLEKLLSPK